MTRRIGVAALPNNLGEDMMPLDRFTPILLAAIERRNDEHGLGGREAVALEWSASGDITYSAATRRIYTWLNPVYKSKSGKMVRQQFVGVAHVDSFLTALELTDAWREELADIPLGGGRSLPLPLPAERLSDPEPSVFACLDCRATVDLSSRGDAGVHTEKGVVCGLCFAKANRGWPIGPWSRDELLALYILYVRESRSVKALVTPYWKAKGYRNADGAAGSVQQAWLRNGWPMRRRGETKRLERQLRGPKLRPDRALNEAEARALHPLHWEQWQSINAIAKEHHERLGMTHPTLVKQLCYTWKLLGLPAHDRIEMTVRASTTNGLSPRDHRERARRRVAAGLTVKGHERQPGCTHVAKRSKKPCTRPAMEGRDVCWSHAPENQEAARERLAEMRRRSPLQAPDRIEPIGPLQEELRAYFAWARTWAELAEATGRSRDWLSRMSCTKQQRNINRQVAAQVRAAIASVSRSSLSEAA